MPFKVDLQKEEYKIVRMQPNGGAKDIDGISINSLAKAIMCWALGQHKAQLLQLVRQAEGTMTSRLVGMARGAGAAAP